MNKFNDLSDTPRPLGTLLSSGLLCLVRVEIHLFWLRDKSLEDADDLPPPDVLILSIIEDLQATIEQLTSIVDDLNGSTNGAGGGR